MICFIYMYDLHVCLNVVKLCTSIKTLNLVCRTHTSLQTTVPGAGAIASLGSFFALLICCGTCNTASSSSSTGTGSWSSNVNFDVNTELVNPIKSVYNTIVIQ